jgi:hypothetical protein
LTALVVTNNPKTNFQTYLAAFDKVQKLVGILGYHEIPSLYNPAGRFSVRYVGGLGQAPEQTISLSVMLATFEVRNIWQPLNPELLPFI